MPKVPVASVDLVVGLSRSARRVSGLAVDQTNCQPVLILCVDVFENEEREASQFRFALSPPAAARFARLLERAVEEHLYGTDEEYT